MTTTENTTRPSNNTITRRKMLQSVAVVSASTLASAAAYAVSNVNAAHADDVYSPQEAYEVEQSGRYPFALHTVAGMRGLVRAHQEAYAHYEEIFEANDWGRATDAQVNDALDLVNDTLEAICRARPLNSDAADLRRNHLSPILVDFTDCCPALMQCMYDALLA